MNRRTFFLAGGALAARASSPADDIVLGVIGAGGRGTLVMTTMQKDPALRVGAICDVYEPNLERAISTASKAPDTHPKMYRNYKELLADNVTIVCKAAVPIRVAEDRNLAVLSLVLRG